ncbi:uncharacterized protein [Rutidosis leptorrhynchoides]|uniref:uncharacterized protein n=1 Tax=Rutidosis leptorrhynchoides TaxID=125765 RepID=UPI003A996EDA
MDHDIQACSFKENVCWNCHKSGHRSVDCPSARKMSSGVGSGARTSSVGGSPASSTGQKRKNPPPPEARAFYISVDTATETDDVITGMFLINSSPARVLFDCGANRSFMSVTLCDKLKFPINVLSEPIRIEVGDGMDWLSRHKASIKCDKKIIYFPLADETRVVARGERGRFNCPLISMMKAKKSLATGCDSFLAYVIDAKKEKKFVSDIPIVFEFPEVFPDELSG